MKLINSFATRTPHDTPADTPAAPYVQMVEQDAAPRQPTLGARRSTAELMQRLNPFKGLAQQKQFGPLSFEDDLASNMRNAWCSPWMIAEFKKHFSNPDPQSLYAQNVAAKLKEHRYSPISVRRHIIKMQRFKNTIGWRAMERPDLNLINSLELDSKRLTKLSTEIGHLTDLRELSVRGFRSSAIPAEVELVKFIELYFRRNHLTTLPAEIVDLTKLNELSLTGNVFEIFPAEIVQMTLLRKLSLDGNLITSLPAEIGQLTEMTMLNLAANKLSDVPHTLANLSNLRQLDLSDNMFTHVPRVLLDFPAGTEIDLTGNPLPQAEIAAVRRELARREAADQPVPQLIVGGERINPMHDNPHGGNINNDDALRIAAHNGLNVHARPLTDAFKQRLDELAQQFPDNLIGSIEQQRSEIRTIHDSLFASLERHATAHPRYVAARAVAEKMFAKGYGQRDAYHNDFRYSSGHVLCYVVLAMEAQWAHTPAGQRTEAEINGVNNLIDFLVAGANFCDTRHIEEVLQMIGIPLSRHAQQNADIVGAEAVRPPLEQVRDALFLVATEVLQQLVQHNPGLDDAALQTSFSKALTSTMQAQHGAITNEQVTAYLSADILPMWDTFKDIALVDDDRAAVCVPSIPNMSELGSSRDLRPVFPQHAMTDAEVVSLYRVQIELNQDELIQRLMQMMEFDQPHTPDWQHEAEVGLSMMTATQHEVMTDFLAQVTTNIPETRNFINQHEAYIIGNLHVGFAPEG